MRFQRLKLWAARDERPGVAGRLGSMDEGIDEEHKGGYPRGEEARADSPFGFDHPPEIQATDGGEQDEINSGVGEPAPDPHDEPVAADVDEVRAGRFVQGHQGVSEAGGLRFDERLAFGDIDRDGGEASGDGDGKDETFIFRVKLDPADLTVNVRLFENGLEGVDAWATGECFEGGGKREAGGGSGFGVFRALSRNPGVDQEKHAEGENENERTDEEPAVQVQIASEPIEGLMQASRS